jgi:DNA-binding response OmpR family regulator
LVVDDDPWSQQVISSQLVELGFRVDAAGDGWEALILAGHARPDLVVAEVHLPSTDAWSMAESLRDEWVGTQVPFIFMADESPGLRPGRSFRPGIDELLTKPFTIVDLRAAVDKTLGTRAGAGNYEGSTKIIVEVPSSTHPSKESSEELEASENESWQMEGLAPALRGDLASFGLSSLLMVIELERMSGMLTVQGPKGTGQIALRRGRVFRARMEGADGLRDAQAIYELLLWAKGTFEFHAGEVGGDDRIEMSTSFLLMEGARLTDERAYSIKKP